MRYVFSGLLNRRQSMVHRQPFPSSDVTIIVKLSPSLAGPHTVWPSIRVMLFFLLPVVMHVLVPELTVQLLLFLVPSRIISRDGYECFIFRVNFLEHIHERRGTSCDGHDRLSLKIKNKIENLPEKNFYHTCVLSQETYVASARKSWANLRFRLQNREYANRFTAELK